MPLTLTCLARPQVQETSSSVLTLVPSGRDCQSYQGTAGLITCEQLRDFNTRRACFTHGWHRHIPPFDLFFVPSSSGVRPVPEDPLHSNHPNQAPSYTTRSAALPQDSTSRRRCLRPCPAPATCETGYFSCGLHSSSSPGQTLRAALAAPLPTRHRHRSSPRRSRCVFV